MSRRELYKSKLKAAAKLIPPAIMLALLVAFFLNTSDLFENPIAWMWVIAIVVVTVFAVRDLFQNTPHLVLDREGISDGRLHTWSSIQQITLVERRYGVKRSQFLVLETGANSSVSIEVTDLTLSPRESFELAHRYWIENRERVPVVSAALPQVAIAPTPAPVKPDSDKRCPGCGAKVDADDCECSNCYERLI